MKLAVFGATGATGQQVVQQAIEQGHSVTALARNPDCLPICHSSLQVVKGDVLDLAAVEETISGVDAVLSCLGRRPFRDKDAVWRGTRNIVATMKKLGVRRLILESAYGVGNSRALAGTGLRIITDTILKWAYHEKDILEFDIASSGLDWVIVRPPALRNGPRTGEYRSGDDLRLSIGAWINRADVADFMLHQLTTDRWLRKTPAIST